MSRENVATVRLLFELFAKRDHERAFEYYDPEIEWDSSRMENILPDIAGIYRGHEEVRAYWRNWLSAWSDLEFELEDVLDAGDEVVALVRNQRQWGRHTGIATEIPPYALVFTFRDGMVVRWRNFPDQEEALEAVGLKK
jgi:ketosteroid isomerase-like protein